MTEPVYYCKDCELFDYDEIRSAKHKKFDLYCGENQMRIGIITKHASILS